MIWSQDQQPKKSGELCLGTRGFMKSPIVGAYGGLALAPKAEGIQTVFYAPEQHVVVISRYAFRGRDTCAKFGLIDWYLRRLLDRPHPLMQKHAI